jgi:hypothetical protein
VPIKETIFGEYAKDWWVWGKCAYCRGRLARSPVDRPTISERHAADMRAALELHVLPRFRTSRLSSIRPKAIEDWMTDLFDQGLSPKRINNIAGCQRVMLGEAKRLGLLAANPLDAVRMFAGHGRDRGTFTIEEIRTMFGPESLEKICKIRRFRTNLTRGRIVRTEIRGQSGISRLVFVRLPRSVASREMIRCWPSGRTIVTERRFSLLVTLSLISSGLP